MHDVGFPDAKILIVDDEPANVVLLERLLKKSGYMNVRTTTDGRQVASFLAWGPDLILLDLQMPGYDGYAVMEELAPAVSAYGGSYLPILVLTADATRTAKERSLSMGAKDFLTKPFDHVEVLLRINNLLETRSLHVELQNENVTLEKKVQERTADLWKSVMELERSHDELRQSRRETVDRLALAAELRDDDTGQHVARMSAYAGLIGEAVGMSNGEVELLRLASAMHDVGKIGIPDGILRKPGKLTAEEFDVMKTHSDIGYRILCGSSSLLLQRAAEIALTHHERFDGGGYPRGLAAADIPLAGRIAAIADVFDALTSDRVYRAAFTLMRAVEMMKEDAGHFDPELLKAFLDSIDRAMDIMQSGTRDPRGTVGNAPAA